MPYLPISLLALNYTETMAIGSGFNYSNSNNHNISDVTAGEVIKCKAAVAYGPGQPLIVEEILVDPPKATEVRIRILFTSICHTDLSGWLGKNEAQQVFPRIFGHEASGLVESVGEDVTDLMPGDHVVPIFNGECRKCSYCKSMKTNLCEKYRVNPYKSTMLNDGKCRFRTLDGKPIYHFMNTSTFTEYTVMDSACVVKINPNAPLDKMSLLSCGVSTGLGAVWNTADVQPGATVAIFGMGAVGLAAVEGARTRGASRIIGIDINPEKRFKGEAIGITDFMNPMDSDKPAHERIREMTGEALTLASNAREIWAFSERHFCPLTMQGWGLTVILGVHATPKMLDLHPMELFDGRRIIGSTFGDFKGKSQLPDFANQCLRGEVKLDEFITHEMPFEKINQAMGLLAKGESLRCLLHL